MIHSSLAHEDGRDTSLLIYLFLIPISWSESRDAGAW